MDKILGIFRHGQYGVGDEDPLSKLGVEQMQKLKTVIDAHIKKAANAAGDEDIRLLFFSFSNLKRAVQSIQALRWYGCDIIITNQGSANRSDISNPNKILKKVLALATYYNATVTICIAHGEMAAVITETAHEFVTGNKLSEHLPYPQKASGFITNLTTGEITPIQYDDLDEKKPPQPAVQESSRPVIRGGPPRYAEPVKKRGPHDIDDDILF